MEIKNNYAKAYKEVLEIIQYFPEEEYNKIPKEKIEFYKNNMDKEHEFILNPEIDLSEQNILKETYTIIITLFQDYFASEKQKEKIKEILELNERKAEKEKNEKYNPDDLFKNRYKVEPSLQNENQETGLLEYKESFFIKLKDFIMKLLHKRGDCQ